MGGCISNLQLCNKPSQTSWLKRMIYLSFCFCGWAIWESCCCPLGSLLQLRQMMDGEAKEAKTSHPYAGWPVQAVGWGFRSPRHGLSAPSRPYSFSYSLVGPAQCSDLPSLSA